MAAGVAGRRGFYGSSAQFHTAFTGFGGVLHPWPAPAAAATAAATAAALSNGSNCITQVLARRDVFLSLQHIYEQSAC